MGSDQSFSSYWDLFLPGPGLHTVNELDVITTLFTLCFTQDFNTARVPSTAGLMIKFSSFGVTAGRGEAVCTTN